MGVADELLTLSYHDMLTSRLKLHNYYILAFGNFTPSHLTFWHARGELVDCIAVVHSLSHGSGLALGFGICLYHGGLV